MKSCDAQSHPLVEPLVRELVQCLHVGLDAALWEDDTCLFEVEVSGSIRLAVEGDATFHDVDVCDHTSDVFGKDALSATDRFVHAEGGACRATQQICIF